MRLAQAEFDRQGEIVKLLLEGINSSSGNHLKYLCDFADAQARYHAECVVVMDSLKRELAKYVFVINAILT